MKIIDVKEASELLCTKKSTIYAWAEQSKIPHVKIHGCLRFDQEELIKWIQRQKKEIK
ncbi:MAG: helix-turn-helix domain-containing protein [Proteobacteria bacterium]|nr:helix-turn-helix domain-containing protein [Pseudomonadota bacterium]